MAAYELYDPFDATDHTPYKLSAAVEAKIAEMLRGRPPALISEALTDDRVKRNLAKVTEIQAMQALTEFEQAVTTQSHSIRSSGAYLMGVLKRVANISSLAGQEYRPGDRPFRDADRPYRDADRPFRDAPPRIEHVLEDMMKDGYLGPRDIDQRCLEAMHDITEAQVLFCLNEFRAMGRNKVKNVSAFMFSLFRKYMGGKESRSPPRAQSRFSQSAQAFGSGQGGFNASPQLPRESIRDFPVHPEITNPRDRDRPYSQAGTRDGAASRDYLPPIRDLRDNDRDRDYPIHFRDGDRDREYLPVRETERIRDIFPPPMRESDRNRDYIAAVPQELDRDRAIRSRDFPQLPGSERDVLASREFGASNSQLRDRAFDRDFRDPLSQMPIRDPREVSRPFRDPPPRDPRDLGPRDPRELGSRDPRDIGQRDPRDIGPRDPRDIGSRDSRDIGPRDVGPRDPRDIGPRDPRDLVPRDPRELGSRDPRELGSRDPREIGSRDPRDVGQRDPRDLGPRDPRDLAPRDPRDLAPRDLRDLGQRDLRDPGPRDPRDVREITPRDVRDLGSRDGRDVGPRDPRDVRDVGLRDARDVREVGPRDPRDTGPRDPRHAREIGPRDIKDPGTRDPRETRDVGSRDPRDSRDPRESRDAGPRDTRDSRDLSLRDTREIGSRDIRDPRDARDVRDVTPRDPRDTRDVGTRDTREFGSREVRDAGPRDPRDARDLGTRDPRDARNTAPRDSRDSRDNTPRDPRDTRTPGTRDARDVRDGREVAARDPRERDTRDIRDPINNRDSRDSINNRDPRDSANNRDSRDSRDQRRTSRDARDTRTSDGIRDSSRAVRRSVSGGGGSRDRPQTPKVFPPPPPMDYTAYPIRLRYGTTEDEYVPSSHIPTTRPAPRMGGSRPARMFMGQGLPLYLEEALDTIVHTAQCKPEDIEPRLIASLRDLSDRETMTVVKEFVIADPVNIRNVSGYLMGIVRRVQRDRDSNASVPSRIASEHADPSTLFRDGRIPEINDRRTGRGVQAPDFDNVYGSDSKRARVSTYERDYFPPPGTRAQPHSRDAVASLIDAEFEKQASLGRIMLKDVPSSLRDYLSSLPLTIALQAIADLVHSYNPCS